MEQKTLEFNNKNNFLAPDALLMFILAAILDLGGIVCFILEMTIALAAVGAALSMALDIIGLIAFSAWTLFRSGEIRGKGVKIIKKLLKRVGIPALIESVPILGDVAFSWVATVYLEVKNG